MRLVTFAPWRPRFSSGSAHIEFVIDKVALEQVFSWYFGFFYHFSFHRIHHYPHLLSGAGTMVHLCPEYHRAQFHPTLTINKIYWIHKSGMSHDQPSSCKHLRKDHGYTRLSVDYCIAVGIYVLGARISMTCHIFFLGFIPIFKCNCVCF
jgi:hypothetical protein